MRIAIVKTVAVLTMGMAATSAPAATPEQNCIAQFLADTAVIVPRGIYFDVLNRYYRNEARQYCEFKKAEDRVEFISRYEDRKNLASQ